MPEATFEAVRDLLWARELSIYQARGTGDLGVYGALITETYMAWPPPAAHPIDAARFRAQVARFAATGSEELTMSLAAFTLDGDTAQIFYTTHRTRLPDGTPCDERFEVIHVWLQRHGDWRLFGGMARKTPERNILSDR